jgi:tetratricopeptide (TPR) repeat protein
VLTAKKKIAVREVVPKSTYMNYWYNVRELITTNSKLVSGIAVGILVVSVAAYFYFSGKAADEKEASRQLRVAEMIFQQQQYKIAITGDPGRGIPGLQEIARKYDNTAAGQSASLLLGNAYLYTGDFEKAYAAFDNASPSSDMLKSAVYAGKAAALEGKKNFAEAAEFFEKAAKKYDSKFLAAQRFLDAGRDYCLAGNKSSAVEMFKKMKEQRVRRFEPEMQRLISQYDLTMD